MSANDIYQQYRCYFIFNLASSFVYPSLVITATKQLYAKMQMAMQVAEDVFLR